MWTKKHRLAAGRKSVRYPSDLTDAEWQLVAPAIPPAKRGGGGAREQLRFGMYWAQRLFDCNLARGSGE